MEKLINGCLTVFVVGMIVIGIIGLGICIGNGGSSNSSNSYRTSSQTNTHTPNNSYSSPATSYTPQPYYQSTPRVSSSRSNYRDLWNECETYSAVLEENGIDHEGMSYPMDYHELEDLRDEYINLLEDNDIDY